MVTMRRLGTFRTLTWQDLMAGYTAEVKKRLLQMTSRLFGLARPSLLEDPGGVDVQVREQR